MAALSGFFGALAALLATIGIYGVIAYVVARRRNEIGIRMALGSTRPQVIGLVMKEAALLVVIGLGIGLAGSLALARFAASLLFGLRRATRSRSSPPRCCSPPSPPLAAFCPPCAPLAWTR